MSDWPANGVGVCVACGGGVVIAIDELRCTRCEQRWWWRACTDVDDQSSSVNRKDHLRAGTSRAFDVDVLKMLVLGVVIAVQACVPSLHRANVGGLISAEALTACDAGETVWATSRSDYRESNMVLGERPEASMVLGYMATSMGMAAIAWLVLPERSRVAAWAPLGAAEASAIVGNRGQDVPLCGL